MADQPQEALLALNESIVMRHIAALNREYNAGREPEQQALLAFVGHDPVTGKVELAANAPHEIVMEFLCAVVDEFRAGNTHVAAESKHPIDGCH